MNMSENKENTQENEIFSQTLRTRRRTYFFDFKISKNEEPYLIITESKRHFEQNTGEYYYEKRKIFLLKEDLPMFHTELGKVMEAIENYPELTANLKENE